MNFPLSVSSGKEIEDHTCQGKKYLISAGLEPKTTGFDRPLLY